MARLRLALTCGEPAGIGPDLCIAIAAMLATQRPDYEVTCLADEVLLHERAALLNQQLQTSPQFRLLHIPLVVPAQAGRLNARNSPWVLQLLDQAIAGCKSGRFDAVVTAPVQKSVINEAGIAFSGHTEYLADQCGVPTPVMLLVAGALRVALATTHLPLTAVSAAINGPLLDAVLAILQADLQRNWTLAAPRIGVCGLNPHAGESGYLGREEIDIIAPAIARARARGIRASGPWPADTIFTPRQLENYDAVLAMYHDQGLPVLKHAGFGQAVNVTLGLPIVRTSVDHGTALDLAGTGKADAASLFAALQMAADIAGKRRN
jgi:4-hydroxythreonine-4-phosphate dehydrogenase